MKRSKHPELTALAWSALAAIRRSKEAATVEAQEGGSGRFPDRGDPAEVRRGQGGQCAARGGEVVT